MAKYKRHYKSRTSRFEAIDAEIKLLEARIEAECPSRGYAPPLNQLVDFSALPLSEASLNGLHDSKYQTTTAIQNACIPHALRGRDVLGAAKTGSGKTLAFLIPLLEILYRNGYNVQDGRVGAAVLSPTRELAVQIYKVLQKLGKYHALSAGLLVGGKREFHIEQQRVGSTNILIATPGRFLQHLEQTPDLDTNDVQMLVLDEADRILDMGFRQQMTCILRYLPVKRQTLLFSATQTRRVADLAALSLHKPEYLGVHDKETSATPTKLQQSMVVIPLEHKLDMAYSFIKSHLKCKTIIFMATCSQVRFVWHLFCLLQPGVSIMALHGKLSQDKRHKVYSSFMQKPHAVLFATDVAARGLDFDSVNWVVQLDAPEDAQSYIHRVGRTARYTNGGHALLCATPAEQIELTSILTKAKVPLKKTNINPNKACLVTQRAASLVASNVQLQTLAKKAFKSHVRSIHLQPNKDIFKVDEVDLDAFASSLGLPITPKVRLEKVGDREQVRKTKNVNHKLHKLKQQIKAEKLARKIKKMDEGNDKKRKVEREEKQEDDGLLMIKAVHEWGDRKTGPEDATKMEDQLLHQVTNTRHPKRIRIDGYSNTENKRIIFDEDGKETDQSIYNNPNEQVSRDELAKVSRQHVDKVKKRLEINMERDRLEEKERVREAHLKKRNLERGDKAENPVGVQLALTDEERVTEDSSASSVDSASDASRANENNNCRDDEEIDASNVDVKAQEELALAMIRKGL